VSGTTTLPPRRRDAEPDAASLPLLQAAAGWLRRNLFSSPFNAALTALVVALAVVVLPPIYRWAVSDAVVSGASKAACIDGGACWAFIWNRLPLFFYGRYPASEYWRVDLAGLLLVLFVIPVLKDRVRHRWAFLLALVTLYPLLALILLLGGVFGLAFVDTNNWGGLMLDVLIAYTTVAGSLPLGIVLALGRRSQLPVVRALSIGFIELWRGVPLLTVLFMSAVLVPLFLPAGVSVDRLLRAMVALILFNSAYMAEVVRGGLQGVPPGQQEAGATLGLHWAQAQALIVLPQALRLVLPAIINTVVDLFKDTTLVTLIGLFDLLGAIDQALKDPAWLGMATEGYLFSAVVFFACCFAMSLYGRSLERRLAAGR
jgi:general L-amino acid transport system permease protein